MAGRVTLVTPYGFRERLCIFGGGGVGKTNAVLSIARRLNTGKMWVLDNDYSWAYARALETDFADVDTARFDINEIGPDWDALTGGLDRILELGDHDNDWLVVDSVSPTWDAVQSWYAQNVMGKELPEYLADLRRESETMKDFNKVLAADGRWQFINKEYFAKFYGALRNWRGHFILTAEAATLSREAGDEERELYGHLGVKPKGQGRMHHVAHTTLFMAKKAQGQYTLTTVKDRNRTEVERLPIGDFAMDYLKSVAGWSVKIVKDVEPETTEVAA